ncbi:MAG: BON domain-containing protein [Thermoguttaceae bacterium]|jgi:osmotically-inducible protein OsmY|nr:BON domain-containing protein [Thermoguttaceae bacterium]
MDWREIYTSSRVLEPAADGTHIGQAVNRALMATGRFLSGQVDASSSEGVVTLRGRVASYYHKQLAQVVALGIIGADQLVNEVEVE